ncbi:MAG TPA: OadG family protein [Anaerolineales bacterium]|jgi:Na+-transporting methylmalonyl-CoA/oxaloacetate decarboxylase gamma subunit
MLANLLIALQITALGMGLVFLAIIVLWLMMSALVAVRFKEPAVEKEAADREPDAENDLLAQAAAAAVAIALAEQSQSTARPLSQPPTALVSAWQLGMRTRQMYEKGGR